MSSASRSCAMKKSPKSGAHWWRPSLSAARRSCCEQQNFARLLGWDILTLSQTCACPRNSLYHACRWSIVILLLMRPKACVVLHQQEEGAAVADQFLRQPGRHHLRRHRRLWGE